MNNLLQIPLIHVRGTARQMGRSHGEACANAIHELYHLRLQNALNHVHRLNKRPVQEKEYLDIARRSLQLLATRHLDTYLEVIGIAEGAQIEKEKLYALQGLTDFRDVLTWPSMNEACTALYLSNCRTQFQRPVSAQTWDLAHDNMPYVIALIREPTDGLKTATLTVTGGLNMAGLNEAGLGILTTNLKSFNSQIGLPYLSLMHLALKCKKLTHATRRIIDSTRSGAHFYLLADAESKFNALEVLPHNYRNLKTSDNYIVHTNHILHSDLINIQRVLICFFCIFFSTCD